MKHKTRLKRVEKEIKPAETLTAILPSWLQDDSYSEPVAKPGEKIIKPSGFMALQPDGSIKWQD